MLLNQAQLYRKNDITLRVFIDVNGTKVGAAVYVRSNEKFNNVGHIFFSDRSYRVLYSAKKTYAFHDTILSDTDLNIKTIHIVVDSNLKYVIPKNVFASAKTKNGMKFLNMDIIKQFEYEN